MDTRSEQVHTILVVEDSDEDFNALVRAFRDARHPVNLVRCVDGNDALDVLYSQNAQADPLATVKPSLILLDLNLPGTDGRELLKYIKDDQRSNLLPIVVLTTSSNPADVDRCYWYGANGYIVKAVNFDVFKRAVESICVYWLRTVLLPEHAGASS